MVLALAPGSACGRMGCGGSGGVLGRWGSETSFDWLLNGGSEIGAVGRVGGFAGLSVPLRGGAGDERADASLLVGLLVVNMGGGTTALRPKGAPTSLLSAVADSGGASGCGEKELAGCAAADQEAGAAELAREAGALRGCKTVRL